MRPLMRARGHELFTPTCTGIGELTHPATREVNLSTHVADIMGALEYEDLNDIVLVGHSYGGMLATVVADRAADVGAPAPLPRTTAGAFSPIRCRRIPVPKGMDLGTGRRSFRSDCSYLCRMR